MTQGTPLQQPPVALVRLAVVVPGRPHGAERHRVQRRGQHLHQHRTDQHVRAEDHIRWAAGLEWRGKAPLDCPVGLDIACYFARSETFRRVKRNRGTLEAPYTGKPDADNVAKLVMDALTKAGVWTDDTRVAELHVRRKWLGVDSHGATVGDERTEVTLWTP